LDDTLWPVEPVMVAAEGAMLSWLTERHPEVMRGRRLSPCAPCAPALPRDSLSAATTWTFLRHQALTEMFAQARQPIAHADEAFEVFYASATV